MLARHKLHHVLLGVWRIKNSYVRGLIDGLSRILVEDRFRIERLHVADATQHEEPDDTFGFGCKVWFAIRRQPGSVGIGSQNSVALQHRTQHQPGESHAAIRQKNPAIHATTPTGLVG